MVAAIDADQVTVELDVTIGQQEQSIFQIVGLPEGIVKESRERVRSAVATPAHGSPPGGSPPTWPRPISAKKARLSFPLAIGVLAASSAVSGDLLAEYALVSEWGLNGDMRPVRGALPLDLGIPGDGMRGGQNGR